MWNTLNMNEKSELMDLFLKTGISSLSDMKRIYDGTRDLYEETLPAAVSAVSLDINKWNELYKEGKVKLSEIPRKYQPRIESWNSGMREYIHKGQNNGLKGLALGMAGVVGGTAAAVAAPYLLPYVAPGTTGGTLLAKVTLPILGGEVMNKAAQNFTGDRTVGETIRKGIEKRTGFTEFSGNSVLSDFGNTLYNMATDAVNPGYYLPYGRLANSIRQAADFGNYIYNDYKLVKSGRKSGNTYREIPIDENNYYRQVTDPALQDAEFSGVIRANPNGKDITGKYQKWAGASFTKGRVYNPRDKIGNIVIEGRGTPELEWVGKSPHLTVAEFDADALRQMEISLGSETTPLYFGNVNTAPSEYFQYFRKGAGPLSKRYWFKNDFREAPSFDEIIREGVPVYGESNIPASQRVGQMYGNMYLIKNLDGLMADTNTSGNVYAGNPDSALANFSTDVRFRPHKNYSTIPGSEFAFVELPAYSGKAPLSIQPMDTFFYNGDNGIPKKFIQIVSGNRQVLDEAQKRGFRVITTPRLLTLYDKVAKEMEKTSDKVGRIQLGKGTFGTQHSTGEYLTEVDRITSAIIGRPSLEDYKYLSKVTGLDPGVIPASEGVTKAKAFNSLLQRLALKKSAIPDFQYPNRESVNGWNLAATKRTIPTDFYGNVFYHPAPSIEYDILKTHGIPSHPKKFDSYNTQWDEYTPGLSPWNYEHIVSSLNIFPLKEYGGKLKKKK